MAIFDLQAFLSAVETVRAPSRAREFLIASGVIDETGALTPRYSHDGKTDMTVTLYSKPACIYCDKAKSFFKRHGIAFDAIDVTKDADALAMLKDRGLLTVPQIFMNGELVIEGGYEGLIRLGGPAVKAKLGL